MMKRAGVILAALLAGWTAAGAGSHLIDARGNYIEVEAVTAIAEDGGSLSAIRLRQIVPGGGLTEEFVPETLDATADLSPQVLFDTLTGRLVVVWVRHDGRRMSLAAVSRGEPGEWSPLMRLDTGGLEPSDPRADIDSTSRLHVVFRVPEKKSGTGLRHRAYDVVTFEPDGRTTDPFAGSSPGRGRRDRRGEPAAPEGGTDEPGPVTIKDAGAPACGPETGSPAFGDFGVEGGCDVAVVWRAGGSRLQVATLIDGRWRRGDVDLGDETAGARPGSLAAEIAKRFCRI